MTLLENSLFYLSQVCSFLVSCIALLEKIITPALILFLLTCELNIALSVLLSKVSPSRVGFNISVLETIEQLADICGPLTWALVLELAEFQTLALLCIMLSITSIITISAAWYTFRITMSSTSSLNDIHCKMPARSVGNSVRNIINVLKEGVNIPLLFRYILVFMLLAAYLRTTSVLIPVVTYMFTKSELIIGLCFTISAGLATLLYPLLGRLVDKLTASRGIILSTLLALPAYAVLAVLTNMPCSMYIATLLVTLALLCVKLSDVVAISCRWKVVTEIAPENVRGTVSSLMRIFTMTMIGAIFSTIGYTQQHL